MNGGAVTHGNISINENILKTAGPADRTQWPPFFAETSAERDASLQIIAPSESFVML
jgi:hypothetical protein